MWGCRVRKLKLKKNKQKFIQKTYNRIIGVI